MSRTQDVQQGEDEDEGRAGADERSVWCMPIREREEKKKVSACVCMEERSHRVRQEVLAAGSALFLPDPSIALDAKSTRIHTQKN